jgi:hypothetical protein
MASTINATTSGVVTTGDSVATLSLQTGGTTAVAIDTAQIVTLSKSLALLGSSSGSVSIAAPATAGTQSYTLPTAVPAVNGYALTATTGGVMSWAAASGSPGGSTTQVQYNNAGSFAGSANMTFDGTTLTAAGFSGPHNGTVGATTANTGAFTTLSASSTVSGTGFSTYLASPPAIGGTAPAAGTFTTAKAIAAATQDAVQLQGRAGGTSSYVATITPTTLTASRTFTLPDAAGTLLLSGGDLGTPSAGVVTNLTGTASININGTVGATTANAGTFSSTVHKGATSGTITLTAPAVAGTQSYTLPTAVPASNGYVLSSTTAGVMSWAAAGSGSPGGSTTQIQYNNAGAFGGVSQMTYNGTTVAVSNDMTIAGLTVGRGASAIGTNTAFGASALGAITTGTATVGIGYNAGASLTTNGSSLFVGYNAGQYTTGNQNTFMGPFCGTGVSGSTNGASNCGVGYGTLTAITTAATNSGLGYQALQAVTTGAGNIGIGSASGINLTTGSNNTYVGTSSFNSAVGVSGELVVNSGGSATGKGANTAFITGGAGSSYNGANTTTWATTSDQRLKKNIVDNNIGLDAINSVRIRNFEYRLPEEVDSELKPSDAIAKPGIQLGVIAQELQAVLPDCVKQESTGVLSVDADNLTWYTVNAIKQLSIALDAANARIAALEAK